MSSPHIHGINALMNNPCFDSSLWFPEGDYRILEVLLNIFEDSITRICPGVGQGPEDKIFGSAVDQSLIPISILLKKLTFTDEARQIMRQRLMPADIDRTKHINEGPSVTAALIRSIADIRLSQTRDFICELMISLCEENSNHLLILVDIFIRYVGYANAAGFLFSRGVTNSTMPSDEHSPDISQEIDPISGEVKVEKEDPWAGMTDEEKEIESEKLFVLFDRLNKTGVIKVVNKK